MFFNHLIPNPDYAWHFTTEFQKPFPSMQISTLCKWHWKGVGEWGQTNRSITATFCTNAHWLCWEWKITYISMQVIVNATRTCYYAIFDGLPGQTSAPNMNHPVTTSSRSLLTQGGTMEPPTFHINEHSLGFLSRISALDIDIWFQKFDGCHNLQSAIFIQSGLTACFAFQALSLTETKKGIIYKEARILQYSFHKKNPKTINTNSHWHIAWGIFALCA